ncbi:aspartyl-tRNA(Asn)/glutamyl-tRNA(Gln) amidotransferase subunit A [Paracoccus aminovorans]|uniref:Aspartyl-tRNA(Asn)/glutamyl-tRNA(Gln) amidotransferase subunit A n=1 Tax=Paracoccus aminovorans TaxID=34004 RepID=A0A1I2YPB6_9RHOB|nr:amidase [Paracoccus aminovorans]CQR87452.1 amidase [Paracoccus aminovorans]SFH27482.1 aspartyl-tRNA(Asn)/glutamyl-tRNA(Gln) amidotransferase subunit A [Paracoccus aminovorans]
MDWLKATAAEQGRAILAGLISPLGQVEAYLDAAARHPYGKRIYARLTPERARAEAIAAHDRARAGLRRGLLDGVAISWKDNIDSAGIATEAGSRLLSGRVPEHDAAILAGATLDGLVCLGKTHMTELAFSGLGVNPMTATPPNSIDPALAPGGSSSGAAVSVALGLAAAAIGSDTGGSIRVPAAWNGLVGFKPTTGAVMSRGVLPLCPRFDVAGPIARTVEDCAELFAVLRGEPAVDLTDADPRGLRLMVLEGVPFDDARAAPVAAFEDAVDRLARAGARVTHAAPPCVAEAMALAPILFAPEAYGFWREQIEDAPDLMYPPILERFRSGREVLAADYIAGWQELDRLRTAWTRLVAGFDAVILPTAPLLPPEIDRLQTDPVFFARENMLTLRNTRIGNLLGLPAISLPTGHPGCGLMLMGAAQGDRALLVAAAAAEAALR